LEVLTDPTDPKTAQSAASGLQGVGLVYDAARLLSAAASRCTDRRTVTNLRQAARGRPGGAPIELAPVDRAHPAGGAEWPPDSADAGKAATVSRTTPGQILSSRELEVATLLLRNQTYREIGERLFISPKTVEHHVARMKQRIGASRRSELFAELRALTKEAG
jgi:DNA-binding CsgD family transcriptional regulator